MRVLMAIPNLNGGGAERMAIGLAARLNRSDIEARLFVHERWGDLIDAVDPTLHVTYQHEGPYRRRDLVSDLVGHVKEAKDADIIIGANEGRAAFTSLISAKVHRKPLLLWVHNDWTRFSKAVSWRQRLVLQSYSRADVIVACSKGAADAFESLVPATNGKIRTIYNGIALDHVRRKAQAPLPQQYEAIFNGSVVLAAARLDHQKGLDYLVSAHATLLGRGVAHQLVILGTGPLRDALQEQALNHGVGGSVHFLGFQENPFRFIARSSVFCLSSRFEGLPLVIAEAFACGAAVVAADCPSGPAELLEGGKYGVLVEPENADRLADGLEKVLSNEQVRRRLQQLSRQRAEAFDLSSTTLAWIDLLREVEQRSPRNVTKA
ncbi:hypothetical protein CYG48_17935 (plasmid) [Neorhizobium sp. SOG26]|uniref:Glycosyltransferase n=1 Tax=Neorhizobium turbinariae TaxID=2937795 RepID=A0ABT0IX64_9HYPH|nr:MULTISPECIES: glycosyltransferase [Neorhizobium]AXV17702.1 hypothetical protein CYG48_17935 [Neorhizobium sp. SOG26]MCK8782473.1 glycosyltransferase [Neorhizobium turbinariae]